MIVLFYQFSFDFTILMLSVFTELFLNVLQDFTSLSRQGRLLKLAKVKFSLETFILNNILKKLDPKGVSTTANISFVYEIT